MPIGLGRAVGTFQPAIGVLLLRGKGQFANVYLNDVVLYLHIAHSCIHSVGHVLMLLCNRSVTYKLNKLYFSIDGIDHLCNIIGPEGLKMVMRTIHGLNRLERLRTVTELLFSFGLCIRFCT